MVGGSTNKLTAAGSNQADKNASTFNAAKFSLVGNNSTGANMFGVRMSDCYFARYSALRMQRAKEKSTNGLVIRPLDD
jgi:hypothetical protein